MVLFQGAPDRVIGLLTLPEVFGPRACVPFEPDGVPVYEIASEGTPIAFIRVDQQPSFAPHGGCEGLEVRLHRGNARVELPTREYDYEMPAAIVVEQRSGWFRIKLDTGTGWVKASLVDRFLSLTDLFEEFVGLTEINPTYAGRLVVAPGRSVEPRSPRVAGSQSVRVIEVRNMLGDMWVHVEVMSNSMCTAPANGPPEIVATGWLPMHAPNGDPTIWFSSRGC